MNAITASRFLTLQLFGWGMERDYQISVIALLTCGVLDLFDGAVARALDCITPFGEVFDAVADGICYGVMLLLLAIYGRVPWIRSRRSGPPKWRRDRLARGLRVGLHDPHAPAVAGMCDR